MAVILYPILHWGLGHATRSAEVIQRLLDMGHSVLPATDGQALSYIRCRFPDMDVLELPPLDVRYPSRYALWNMALQSGTLLRSFYRDHRALRRLAEQYDVDVVISDHRLGAYLKGKKNILLLHQIEIPLRNWYLRPLARAVTRRLLMNFDEYWVPDFPGHLLSGQMSCSSVHPLRFIGPISHFMGLESNHFPEEEVEVLAVLSGPEPQRMHLEKALISQLIDGPFRSMIVRGIPNRAGRIPEVLSAHLSLREFLPPEQLFPHLRHSKYVIARSGYSTIMDLVGVGKSALLIPTPGQPEQEYLSRHLAHHPSFVFQDQRALDLPKAFVGLDRARPMSYDGEVHALLERAVHASIGSSTDNARRRSSDS